MKVLDLQDCWFMHGWAEHIGLGVDHTLGADYRVWLHWAIEQLGIKI